MAKRRPAPSIPWPIRFRQCRHIAVSPKLRVVLVGLHKDTAPEIKARLRGALLGMSSTPAGRQILTLFQSDWLIAMDASAMRASLDLLAAYDRIKARRPGASR